MTNNRKDVEEVLQQLEGERQVESLQYLVEKLPIFVDSLKVVENQLDFVTSSLNDRTSLELIADDVESKVERLHIDETHLEAMLSLVQLLPRLTPVVEQLDNVLSFAESVWGDERTVDQLTKTVTETVNHYVPIDKGKELATVGKEIVEETKEEFEQTKQQPDLSIFGVMKMLKDPVVQDGLKLVQAFLNVVERKRS